MRWQLDSWGSIGLLEQYVNNGLLLGLRWEVRDVGLLIWSGLWSTDEQDLVVLLWDLGSRWSLWSLGFWSFRWGYVNVDMLVNLLLQWTVIISTNTIIVVVSTVVAIVAVATTVAVITTVSTSAVATAVTAAVISGIVGSALSSITSKGIGKGTKQIAVTVSRVTVAAAAVTRVAVAAVSRVAATAVSRRASTTSTATVSR